MPYTATTWVDGTTMGNQTRMNNLETQYTEATNSLEQDLFTAFVFSGAVPAKDGSVATQLDIPAYVAFVKQTDGTLRRRNTTSTTKTTATPSSTYYLYLQPDGTWYWSTTNSPAANSLAICTVTTDGSGNILAVTDARPINPTWLSGMVGAVTPPPFTAIAGNATALSEAWSDAVRDVSPGDLLAFYHLGEASGTNAADASGNGLNGTYVGTPTLGATGLVTGFSDTAVTLNGTSQYVTLPLSGLPAGAQAWTVHAVVKPTNATNASDGAVIAIGDSASNGRVILLAQQASGGWKLVTWGGTALLGGTSAAGVTHRVVGTFDGTNMRLYVDGALVAGPTPPGVTMVVGGSHAAIGAWFSGAWGDFYAGTVDEVGVWGVCLSASQVAALNTVATTGPTALGNLLQVNAPGWQTQQSGAANGFNFLTWNGSAGVEAFSVGGRYKSANAWVDASGNFGSSVPGATIPTTRNGAAWPAPIFTGPQTPTGTIPVGAIWLNQ